MADETPKKAPQSPLEQRLQHLRNSNPKVFNEFVTEFANYTTQTTSQVIYAPAPDVQMAQGRAQMCHHLLQVLVQIMNDK